MADLKVTQLTENADPSGDDLMYMVNDPGGSPIHRSVRIGELNLLPDGQAVNYTISVTVATNDITVALKTKSGGNPSPTDPVSAWINGTRRACRASLSVTKNDGTNWFGSGSTAFATLERDYFVYLIWNTTPATDIMDIGFSPIAHGRVYSDFSSTSTAQNYLAHANASDPAATDNVICIGRFAATLSATASFNWSVPTFTNTNLIQRPIFSTRRLTWAPSLTGYTATVPTSTSYQYFLQDNFCTVYIAEGANGTSNATTLTMTAPFTAATVSNGSWTGFGSGQDNGSGLTTPVRINISTGSSNLAFFPNASAASTWTNANGKRITAAQLTYPIG